MSKTHDRQDAMIAFGRSLLGAGGFGDDFFDDAADRGAADFERLGDSGFFHDAADRGAADFEVANPEWADDYGDDLDAITDDDLHDAFHSMMGGFGADRWPLALWQKWGTRDWPNGQRGYGYTVRGSYGLTWAIVPAGGRRWNLNVTNKHGFRKTWGPFKNPTAATEAKRKMLAGGMAERLRSVGRYTDPRTVWARWSR